MDEDSDQNIEEIEGTEIFDDAEIEQNLILANQVLPDDIPIIPLSQRPLFPGLTIPLQVADGALDKTLKTVSDSESRVLGVTMARDFNQEAPLDSELCDVGTVVVVLKIVDPGQGMAHLLVNSIRRFKKEKVISSGEVLRWKVSYIDNPTPHPDEELKAYTTAVLTSIKELLKSNPIFSEQMRMLLSNLNYNEPGLLMDLVASMTSAEGDKLQGILETFPLIQRAEKLLLILQEEIQLFQLQEKIKKNIEERISKQQKEFFLREQLREIKKELGIEKDDKTAEIEAIKERLEKRKPTEEAQSIIDEEINKLSLLEPVSAEYAVVRNYLDWLTVLPWGIFSKDSFDVPRAREILDRDHYGLKDVKERILEFISTGFKTGKISGTILCFVGPPGTGKTSIGKSIAEALSRKFYRFSLGGMRDEAEIKGHRRTYIGAMPGKLIQSLKMVGTSNPVIMLDEIDKIGSSFRGDPASSLLEVLDPEQNHNFHDHYLDVRFDLGQVMFIATANTLDTIPPALLDRMEILSLSGYIPEEKVQIAARYLLPRAMKDHGLTEAEVEIQEAGLRSIITSYAREAGVRNLENKLRKIMRRITMLHAEGDSAKVVVTAENVQDFLGMEIFRSELLYKKEIPGVITGLAWTSMGGTTLVIECTAIASKNGGYKQTGQLGDVMRESSEIAYSLVRSRCERYGIELDFFDKHFIHLHVPAGATPKDGPSAGITMALALYSLATDQPCRLGLAMTGELSLTGKVLPVGGIREKVIAARRMGLRELILPKENLRDYKELPDYVRQGMKIYFANYFDDVLTAVYKDP